jgi:tight adherence protein B
MSAVLAAALAAYGTFLLYSSVALGWRGIAPGPRHVRERPRTRLADHVREWMTQAGLGRVALGEFVAVLAVVFVLGSALALVLFGGPVPALVTGAFAASFPLAAYRRRRTTARAVAQDAWPRMIEELRILTGSVGRSIPQALFEVGASGPTELRPAFEAAHREWLLTTDFERTVRVLRDLLADPTCDATCETLLIAHELGGTDLDRRLEDLAEDRRQDARFRKDARARQSGVRFARRFVLLVPLGMAAAGLSVGNGRAAYQTPLGQLAVLVALGMTAACWVWAGRMMRLPDDERVFIR